MDKQNVGITIVRRAIERGELGPNADPAVFHEVAPALMFFRVLVTGEPIDDVFFTHVADDVLIPLLDARRPDQVGAFERAFERLGAAAEHVDVLVPGHGAVATGPEVAARIDADRAYIDALRLGEAPVDARLDQDWLTGPHQSNLEQARQSSPESSASGH